MNNGLDDGRIVVWGEGEGRFLGRGEGLWGGVGMMKDMDGGG